MKSLPRISALALAMVLLVQPLPAFALDAATRADRQEDLAFLISSLETKHPDMYANTTREAVAEKKAYIEKNMDKWDDFGFALELQTLVAMLGDSHTSAGISTKEVKMLPFSLRWMEGKWMLFTAPAAQEALLGQELVKIGDMPIADVQAKESTFISADNAVKARRSFGQSVHVWELLQHFGIISPDAKETTLTVRDQAGKDTTFSLTPLTREELNEIPFVSLPGLRAQVPATEPDAKSIYKMDDLGDGTLYIQYNSCMQDENLPMSTFGEQVADKLEGDAYGRIIIDLRNNGGGSDGVIWGMMEPILAAQQRGAQLDVLIGEATFSSALINAVQLKQLGATLYGEETGGSVSHFGEVTSFNLPNSDIRVTHSNKYFDLSAFYQAASGYGISSFRPDVAVSQTVADYRAGVDTAVQEILKTPAPTLPETVPAAPSSMTMLVDGTRKELPAYLIAQENYVALRDLAAAASGTPLAFDVLWVEEDQGILLTPGKAYTPVGGENAPLPSGVVQARPASAMLVVDNMPLVLSGAPGALRVYNVGDRHYLRLRDLCGKLGASAEWNEAENSVSITTK